MLRKRYNSYLAIGLLFIAILFAVEGLYLAAVVIFAIAWIWGTSPDNSPDNAVSVWQVAKETFRMLPWQVFAVSLIWICGFALYPNQWVISPLVVVWFFGSFLLPVWLTKNADWYLENHLYVVAGYFALCAACWAWVGPMSIDLISWLFNV